MQQVTVEDRQNGKEGIRQPGRDRRWLPSPQPGGAAGERGDGATLEKLSADYDLVVIDSPPLPILADAIPW